MENMAIPAEVLSVTLENMAGPAEVLSVNLSWANEQAH